MAQYLLHRYVPAITYRSPLGKFNATLTTIDVFRRDER